MAVIEGKLPFNLIFCDFITLKFLCLFSGKRFNAIDFLACVMMSAGLIFFTLADSKVQPDFSVYGM